MVIIYFVGLYAANVLLENGVDNFVVLEARQRVGGRTFTSKVSVQGTHLGLANEAPNRIKSDR